MNDNSRNILVVAPEVPWPPRQGASIRNFHILRGLSRHHHVTLLAFGDPEADMTPLVEWGVRILAVPKPAPRSKVRRGVELFTTPTPDLARRLACETMLTAARLNALIAARFDVIQVEGLEMAPYGLDLLQATPLGKRARLIYDAHNAEWVLQKRAFLADIGHPARFPGAVYSLLQTLKLRRFESRVLRASWRAVAVSEADAAALRSLHRDAQIVVAPNGVDTAFFRPGDPTAVDGDLCVFTGKMDFRPNVDAVRWFCEMVWPRLHAARPSTRFAIVGRDPSPSVKALTEIPGVMVTGLVQDVRPWIARAGAVVAPLRVGGGTRLKILEAMAMAKPIVATAMAIDGLNVEVGEDLLVADDPAGMTEAVLSVLSDPERARSLGRSARRRAEFEYRWEKVGWEIEALYRDAAI